MPRSRKVLPEGLWLSFAIVLCLLMVLYVDITDFIGFSLHTSGERAYCERCSEIKGIKWMNVQSVTTHLRTAEHCKNVELLDRRRQEAAANNVNAEIERGQNIRLGNIDPNDIAFNLNTNVRRMKAFEISAFELLNDAEGNELLFLAGELYEEENLIQRYEQELETYNDHDLFLLSEAADEETNEVDDIGLTNAAADFYGLQGEVLYNSNLTTLRKIECCIQLRRTENNTPATECSWSPIFMEGSRTVGIRILVRQ